MKEMYKVVSCFLLLRKVKGYNLTKTCSESTTANARCLNCQLILNTVLKHHSYKYNATGTMLLEIFPNLLLQIASSYK